MNKSMTGYGQARLENDQFSIMVEVRSLNSKFLDVNIRLPKSFNEKELVIRNIINEKLERGKISMVIEFVNKCQTGSRIKINDHLFREYYNSLKTLSDEIGSKTEDLFRLAIQFPDVIENLEDNLNHEQEWQVMLPIVLDAIEQCDQFRKKEGAILAENISTYLEAINESLQEIKELDPKRIERVKSRITGNLKEFALKEELDNNRLEQELIYYIEKLDIKEEILRLESHIAYFREILKAKNSMGKKMNFLSQEIGREINTIGSKCNDAAIQKLVVNMKEELEKIKEQSLNLI